MRVTTRFARDAGFKASAFRSFPFCLQTVFSVLLLAATPASSQIRIHAGGGAYTDSSGNFWGADANYQGGNTFATEQAIGNTPDPRLYQTGRWGDSRYAVSVPNGTYSVTLKFAEPYFTAVRSRVFNVAINNQQVLSNFDIIAAAGGQFIATDRTFQVAVTTQSLNVAFTSVIDNPAVSAIQIVPQGASPPLSAAFTRIHAGGDAYTDSSGNFWSADGNYQGGNTFSTAQPIGNTSDPVLYQTGRWGDSQYFISVPNGTYSVTLKFAEPYFTATRSRVFNVAINNQQVLSNFDIIAAAGGQFVATDRTFQVAVTTQSLNVALSSVIDNPAVSAIQIVPQGGSPSPPGQPSVPTPPIPTPPTPTPPTPTPPTPTPPSGAFARIRAGGEAYTDSSGNVWSADRDYEGGRSYSTSHPVANTSDPALYQTARYGDMQYVVPAANGIYQITLKFAEPYFTAANNRVFNVAVNNEPVLSSFDIFAAAGGQFIAVDQTFQITVTDGSIHLSFRGITDSPLVNSIQIDKLTSVPGVPATSANEFLSSLGVNTHFAQGYDAQKYVAPIRYLGIRNIRDGDLNLSSASTLHQQTGVLTDVLVGCADFSGSASSLPSIVQYLASTGSLLALEGTNEPNNWPVIYNGQQGGGTGSWLPVAQCQRDLYSAVKGHAVLNSYPVLTVSQGGGETDNVGLQFLTIPSGAGPLLPAGTRFADYANVHNYVSSNQRDSYVDNQAWLAADPQQNSFPGNTLYTEFGRTWAAGYTGYSAAQLQKLPRVSTETGWDSVGSPGGEVVQGKILVNTYLAQFARGWKYTFIYQLIDGEGGASNQGLFRADYAPKLAANYIHNLTTILADTGSLASPGLVNYSIANMPATVHVVLLQKSNGYFELAVWDERASGSDAITVNLGASFAKVSVYDVTAGTTPIQILTNASLVPLTLSDHAVILEFK